MCVLFKHLYISVKYLWSVRNMACAYNSPFRDMSKLNAIEDLEEFENHSDERAPGLLVDLFEINIEGQSVNNKTAKQLIRVVHYSTNLNKINLEACGFSSNQMSNILKTVCKNGNLKNLKLDLRSTTFNYDCCKSISALFGREHPNVCSLKLPQISNHNWMEDILKSLLKSRKKIFDLDISFSRLSEKSLNYLENILRKGLVIRSLGVEQCEGWRDGKFYQLTPSDRDHILDANKASNCSQNKTKIRWAFRGPGANGAMQNTDTGKSTKNVFKLAKFIGKEQKEKAVSFFKNIREKALTPFRKRKLAEEKFPDQAKKAKNDIEMSKQNVESIPHEEAKKHFHRDSRASNELPNIFFGIFANFGPNSTQLNNLSNPH